MWTYVLLEMTDCQIAPALGPTNSVDLIMHRSDLVHEDANFGYISTIFNVDRGMASVNQSHRATSLPVSSI
jgi:hypothetical protein